MPGLRSVRVGGEKQTRPKSRREYIILGIKTFLKQKPSRGRNQKGRCCFRGQLGKARGDTQAE